MPRSAMSGTPTTVTDPFSAAQRQVAPVAAHRHALDHVLPPCSLTQRLASLRINMPWHVGQDMMVCLHVDAAHIMPLHRTLVGMGGYEAKWQQGSG